MNWTRKISWGKEVARDVIALGSIPFYFIVIIRAIIGKYEPFVHELLISFIILVLLSRVDFNQYIARGFVLVLFTSLFYKAPMYTMFAFILWIGMIFSARYLGLRGVAKGVVFGILASLVGYIGVN